MATNEEKPCSTCLKPISPQHFQNPKLSFRVSGPSLIIIHSIFKIAGGINNPSAERYATKQIMDLIGEKFGEMIVDGGDKNDIDEDLRFNPLRFDGKRGLWRSIYDNKRGFNPKQIKDLIKEKIIRETIGDKRGILYESLKFNPLRFVEKRFNPLRFGKRIFETDARTEIM